MSIEPPAATELLSAVRERLALEALPRSAGREQRRAAVFRALAAECRHGLQQRWAEAQHHDAEALATGRARRVHYLSMEFLIGRALANALAALGGLPALRTLLAELGLEASDVLEGEPDAGLGNGGLGRLAACFLDAFAEQGFPSFGYGLRYQYGMFSQRIQDGRQVEVPDDWLRNGNEWEVARPELRYRIGFGGRVQADGDGRRWTPNELILAQAYDFIVPAHHSRHVSTLRQWHASAAEPIDFQAFCRGEYAAATQQRIAADALNWVLYPDDSTDAGRELRLKQEYLLVSASLQDLVARHLREGGRIEDLGRRNAIHLNDTHPALAPAELLRLLMDEHGLDRISAWRITRQALSYTNHTLLPEALETWPVPLIERLLPRHLELIYEINDRFLSDVRLRFPGDEGLVQRVSLIDEAHGRRVRMAGLAIVASHKINGVAALHSRLMTETIFAEYARLYPGRFFNVTNGVTPRRWLQQANPGLSALLDRRIGTRWRQDLLQLGQLRAQAEDAGLQQELLAVKHANKQRLAALIRRELGLVVDPSSLFDVQIKRIHEYKRQLLNLLRVVGLYQSMLSQPDRPHAPRTVILSGKAASAYRVAKQIIQLAHDIARVINSDPRVSDRLKLVFLPNYSVSLAEVIIPAADLSEQISTAGTEASGTGNMKFALNGALTIGTWDGANIEMAEAIGEDDVYIFGRRVEDIAALRATGYDPALYAEQDLALRHVLDAIAGGAFSPGEPGRYRDLIDSLLQRDRYFLLADYADYAATQARVDAHYADRARWAACAARNIAGMGAFSADRCVREYWEQVWSPAALAQSRLDRRPHA
ncbi:MAG: glycogen/starch/alpha-glucan phosphorylase [Lysobacterales bacterium]